MRGKYFIVILAVILAVIITFILRSGHLSGNDKKLIDKKVETPIGEPIESFDASLFFPYWSLPQSSDELLLPQFPQKIDAVAYIYFGLSATAAGTINKNEPGFVALPKFITLSKTYSGKKLLTLRMLSDEINETILDSQEKQNRLINEAVLIALQNDFDGILLDLEISSLPTKETVNDIATFVEIASRKIRSQKLEFDMAIFGDTFYRARPYDLTELSKHVDWFYVMAYDLHKAGGNPGPNFPLTGRETYGYDFASMVSDLRKSVSDNQLTVVFGFYGYDWWVDEKRRPIKPASALTLAEIKSKFLDKCELEDCVVRRDELAVENEINYVDAAAGFHVVWFEDEESVAAKMDQLSKSGIGSIGIWATGYY